MKSQQQQITTHNKGSCVVLLFARKSVDFSNRLSFCAQPWFTLALCRLTFDKCHFRDLLRPAKWQRTLSEMLAPPCWRWWYPIVVQIVHNDTGRTHAWWPRCKRAAVYQCALCNWLKARKPLTNSCMRLSQRSSSGSPTQSHAHGNQYHVIGRIWLLRLLSRPSY